MYTAVYTLASDGHVGRSRVQNPAPLNFFSCFMFSFLCFSFFYLHAHGGSVPWCYVCLYSSVHAADGAVYDTPRKKSMAYESRKQSTRAGRIHRGIDTAQDG